MGLSVHEKSCLAAPPCPLFLLNMRWTSALLNGVYGSGLKTGVLGLGNDVPGHNSGGVRSGKFSLVTKGGEYSDDITEDRPALTVDASLKQRGDSGSGKTTSGSTEDLGCGSCEDDSHR